MFAVDNDETGKTEVDGGAQKAGCYSEADKIPGRPRNPIQSMLEIMAIRLAGYRYSHEEGVIDEDIVVQMDSGDVAYDFKSLSTKQGYHEAPCTVANAKENLSEEEDDEESKVKRIAGQGGDVTDICPLKWACLGGAEPGLLVESHIERCVRWR